MTKSSKHDESTGCEDTIQFTQPSVDGKATMTVVFARHGDVLTAKRVRVQQDVRIIYKYSVALDRDDDDDDDFTIELPSGAQLLTVQTQDTEPYVWAFVNPNAPKVQRKFKLVLTGQSIEATADLSYVGTFQLSAGSLVYHLFVYPEAVMRAPTLSAVRTKVANIEPGKWASVCGEHVERRAIDGECCYDACGVQEMTLDEVSHKIISVIENK